MDVRTMSRDFLREFIELYKSQPSLWKIKSKEYSNRDVKARAYDLMVDKLKEIDDDATKDSVQKKINSLRTCFRKEYKKVQTSMTSGTSPDDVYIPNLWYFKHLMFLRDQEMPRPSVSNMHVQETSSRPRAFEDDEDQNNEEDNSNDADLDILDSSSSQLEGDKSNGRPPATPVGKPSKKKKIDSDGLIAMAVQKMTGAKDEDEFDIVGKNIASKLRRLPHRTRILAEKLLNDVLFEAEMDRINVNSMVLVDPQWDE